MERKYKKMNEKEIEKIASDEQVQLSDIMSWYKNASSFQARVDMVIVMKKRIEVCMNKKIIW